MAITVELKWMLESELSLLLGSARGPKHPACSVGDSTVAAPSAIKTGKCPRNAFRSSEPGHAVMRPSAPQVCSVDALTWASLPWKQRGHLRGQERLRVWVKMLSAEQGLLETTFLPCVTSPQVNIRTHRKQECGRGCRDLAPDSKASECSPRF